MTDNFVAKRLKVNGIVQGVGFRPFVFQLAQKHGLKGEVANTSAGVAIHIEGLAGQIACFESDLATQAPPWPTLSMLPVKRQPLNHTLILPLLKARAIAECRL
jgi:hydrogenase maturation protein HypF